MRKKLILFLMLALFGSTSFLRADVVEIGDGTSTTYMFPVNTLYKLSFTEMVYTASEIGTAGTINSIGFHFNGNNTLERTIVVYMKNVSRSTFASSDDYESVTAADIVYTGTLQSAAVDNWVTLTLDTPFAYDGTSNLMIAFDDNTGSWSSRYFYYTTVASSCLCYYSDSYDPDPYDLGSYTGSKTTSGNRPNVQINITSGAPVPPPVPTGDIVVTPNPFDMGERPINAWMEPYTIRIQNGGPDTHIEAAISDVSGLAPFSIDPEINMDLAYEDAVEATISLNPELADGDYAEEFTLFYAEDGKSVIQIPLTATTYTAVRPDVVELKKNLTSTMASFTQSPTGMHANYLLQGMTAMLPDAVYYFNLENDCNFEADIDKDGIIALYKYRSNFHPTTASEPVLMGENHIETTLLAGKYLMIVAAEELNSATISGSVVEVPAPSALTYIAPANMAHDITAPDTLKWEGGDNATQYQVIFGTTYPPTQVVQDWTPIDEYYGAYPLAELNSSTQYFWQIKVKNSQGEEEGPVWGFTTTMVPPTNVRLSENQIFTDGSTLIKWNSMSTGGGYTGEFTVCDGTSTSSYIPVYGLWMDDYTRSEMIYPAEMLQEMTGGDITSLKYYISSAASGPWTGDVFNVYMMEVDATTLSSYYTSADAEIVYTGSLDGQGTEMVINLDNAYHYNGGNLLVGIEEITCDTYKSCSFYGVTATGASASGYSSASLAAVTFNQRDFLPKTTFTCGGRGYRDVTATRSFKGYNVYLVYGESGGGSSTTTDWTDDFEDGNLTNWTTIDADGDYDTWQNATPAAYGIGDAHSGTNCASSWSWNSYTMYPDNWMISPMIENATSVHYFVATNTAYPDHYGVYASSTGTSTSDFSLVYEETASSKSGNGTRSSMTQAGTRAMSAWMEKNIALPAGTKYVAFRHWNSDDMNYLFIDDVTISTGAKTDAPTLTAIKLNDDMLTTNQYLFEADETFYNMPDGANVHVTAVYDEGESGYDTGNNKLYISGYSSFVGTVNELISGAPIANARVTFVGKDEFNHSVSYNATTNASGEYEVEVKVGNYTGTATLDGFEPSMQEGLSTAHLTPTTVDFVMHELYNPVYKVYAEDMNNEMAKVQWSLYDFATPSGGGSGGGSASTFTEGFEGGMPADWTIIDANSDGNTWCMTSNIPSTWTYYASMTLDWYRTGTNAICSGSYINGIGALNPDEYLVTPQVNLVNGSTFSFWAAATDANYPADHFGVFVSDNGTSDWTSVQEWTLTAKSGGTDGGVTSRDGNGAKLGTWHQFTVDLSDYAGSKYIAIRHFNCYDQYIMCVDDIELSTGKADRSVNHYTLYRKAILKETPLVAEDSLMLVDNYTDTLYADFDWFNVEPGLYQYGVSAVYPIPGTTKGERGGASIDFETGDFSQYDFTMGPTYPWTVVAPSSGNSSSYCIKSGNGGVASSTSTISATVEYANDGTVSFIAECKGEGTSTIWDKCIFELDGTEKFCYGANHPGWNEYSYDVAAGSHTFTWKYSKDSSVNPTGDYMMVDDIVFQYEGGAGGDDPITAITWSNILPKEMTNVVIVNATSTIGSVEGATMKLMNQNESFVYNETFDETGEIVFEDFRKGEYTLQAGLEGFVCDYSTPVAVSIWNDTVRFTINFSEYFKPVESMVVSSTGYARWTDMGILPEGERVAERYIVNMNNTYQGETTDNYMQLDVNGLVDGNTYPAKVALIYSTGMSPWTETTFVYHECDTENPAIDTIYNSNMDVTLVWNGGTPTPPVPPTPPTGDVTVKLTAGNVWGDGTGYQMLLDDTHSLYGTTIPTSGALSLNCSGNEAIYAQFSHKIPTNADGNCSTNNMVINNTVEITIPAGTYDWCITNPTPGDRIWIAASNGNVGGRYDDYQFEAGCTYEFTVSMYGTNDGVDVTITGGKSMNQPNMGLMSLDNRTNNSRNNGVLSNAGVGFGEASNSLTDDGNWYYYDNGVNEDAIGTGGGNFWWAIMLPAGSYEGNKLTKVAAYDYMAMTGNATIYQGGTSAPGGSALGQTNVTFTGSNDFVEFTFAEPVTLDPEQNVWVVFYNGSGATYPAAVCSNTGNANGRWVSLDGSTWEDMLSYSLSYTFMIRAYIETGGGGGGAGASAITPNKFNILVDGEVVGATADNTFTWTCPDYDEHLYEVVWVDANYNISCPEGVWYQIPLTDVNEIDVVNSIYPNPTSGDLHINANGMERISIINTLGQVVYDQAVKCDATVINMARFEAGVYMVSITTKNGSSVKRVVVTK